MTLLRWLDTLTLLAMAATVFGAWGLAAGWSLRVMWEARWRAPLFWFAVGGPAALVLLTLARVGFLAGAL